MKRFVSYLYSIYNNQKIHNAGFARMELRTGRNRVEIHLKENGYAGKTGTVYLFIRKRENIQGISIGNITFRNNQAEFRYEQAEENIGQTPWKIMQMNGILIIIDGKAAFLSQWDEQPVDTTRFEVWELEKKKEAGAGISSEQKEGQQGNNQTKQNERLENGTHTEQNKRTRNDMQTGQNSRTENGAQTAQKKQLENSTQTERGEAATRNRKIAPQETESVQAKNAVLQEAGAVQKENAALQGAGAVQKENAALQGAGAVQKEKTALQGAGAVQKEKTALQGAGTVQKENAALQRAGAVQTENAALQRVGAAQTDRTGLHNAQDVQPGKKNANGAPIQPGRAALNLSNVTGLAAEAEADSLEENQETADTEQISDIQTAELQPQAQNQWSQNWRYMLRTYPVLNQFQEEAHVLCVRIEIKDVRLLPEKYWSMINNSFLLHGFFNYRHLAFGKIEQSWFVGVPGIYQNQEHVMASIFGFPDFLPQKQKNEQGEQPGYWYRILEAV